MHVNRVGIAFRSFTANVWYCVCPSRASAISVACCSSCCLSWVLFSRGGGCARICRLTKECSLRIFAFIYFWLWRRISYDTAGYVHRTAVVHPALRRVA